MKISNMGRLECKVCEFDYSHLIGVIQVECADENLALQFIINGEHEISCNALYPYRSQGNVHLLFRCEHGHFFIISFDGHKGNVYVEDNKLMDRLADFLNEKTAEERKRGSYTLRLTPEMVGYIEEFLKLVK